MNWYNLLKLADKHNILLQQGYNPEIVDWAVKLNNKYAVWLANMATQQTVRPGEDDEKLTEVLEQFNKVKNLSGFHYSKDIGQYKSYGDLVKAIGPFLGQQTEGEHQRAQETEGAHLVLDQHPYRAFRLDTPEAAAKLCRDTGWCVKDPKYYKNYAEQGPIYLVEKDGEKHVLVHYESNQFMDIYDNKIDPEHKFEIVELLKPVTGKNQINDPALAYEYALDVIKGRFPEGEAAIAQDANRAYSYARNILKGRFPEGEAIIAQDATLAYEYARNILKAPWPEGGINQI